jgi:hypothetical protein
MRPIETQSRRMLQAPRPNHNLRALRFKTPVFERASCHFQDRGPALVPPFDVTRNRLFPCVTLVTLGLFGRATLARNPSLTTSICYGESESRSALSAPRSRGGRGLGTLAPTMVTQTLLLMFRSASDSSTKAHIAGLPGCAKERMQLRLSRSREPEIIFDHGVGSDRNRAGAGNI